MAFIIKLTQQLRVLASGRLRQKHRHQRESGSLCSAANKMLGKLLHITEGSPFRFPATSSPAAPEGTKYRDSSNRHAIPRVSNVSLGHTNIDR